MDASDDAKVWKEKKMACGDGVWKSPHSVHPISLSV